MQTPRHGNFKHQKWVEGMWSMLDLYVYLGPVLHTFSLLLQKNEVLSIEHLDC